VAALVQIQKQVLSATGCQQPQVVSSGSGRLLQWYKSRGHSNPDPISLFQSIKGEQVTVLQNTTPFDTFSMTMLARSLLGQFFTGDLSVASRYSLALPRCQRDICCGAGV